MREVPTPVNVRVSDDGAGLVDLPPELESVVFRDNHIGGIGHVLPINGKTDYYSGVAYTGIDGKVTLPPGVDEITLPTSEGNVRVMIEFEGAMLVSDGRYLHRSTNGTTFTQVLDVGATGVITGGCAYGASDGGTGVVIGWEIAGASQLAYFSEDSITYTQYTADATREFSHFFVNGETLFGLDQPSTYRTTTDPFSATATFGTATKVGDQLGVFQGGFVVSNILVIFKTDRAYTVAADGTVKILIAQFADTPDDHNFEHFVAGHNSNIYTTVDEEMWEYDPVGGGIRPLGLSRLPDTQLTPAASHQDGAAYDGVGIYAIHHAKLPHEAAGGASLVRIVFDSDSAPTYERWLTETVSGYRPQGPLHYTRAFSNLNTGRGLYFNTTTAGKIGLLNIFRAPNPVEDTSSEYQTAPCHLFTGDITHNFPGQQKDYTELTLDVTGLSATSTLSVYYYLDSDLSTRYTIVEDLDVSGLYSLNFPEPTSGRTIMLDFVRDVTTAAESPVIHSWTLRAAVKFRIREVASLGIRVADNLEGRRGTIIKQTAMYIRNRLRELRDAEDIAIKYQDYRGYEFDNVRILPGFSETDASDESANLDETILQFRVMRVSSE